MHEATNLLREAQRTMRGARAGFNLALSRFQLAEMNAKKGGKP